MEGVARLVSWPSASVKSAIKAGFVYARKSAGVKAVLIRAAVFSISLAVAAALRSGSQYALIMT